MPLQSYPFTISTAFSNGVDSNRLAQEIEASSITVALDHIGTSGDICTVWFKAVLSSPEETTLNALVAAHSGEPLPVDAIKVSLDGPKETTDDRLIVNVVPSTSGFKAWFCGADDNPSPTPPDTGRGTGTAFALTFTTNETQSQEFSFKEPVELHSGFIYWSPVASWAVGDKTSIGIRMPATSVVANGTNTGNANLVSFPPLGNRIVPAAGNGAYDVNLTTAVPVPALNVDGYWDVTYDTGVVFVAPVAGQSSYHLYDFEVKSYILRNVIISNVSGLMEIRAYRAAYFHHKWKLFWSVTRASTGAGSISMNLFMFRKFTQ